MQVHYSQKPKAVVCMQLPNGHTDIWMTRDPVFVEEQINGSEDISQYWSVDEQYIRFNGIVTVEQIESDFDKWWDRIENADTSISLEQQVEELRKQNDILMECIMEMSTIVYA